MVWLAARAGAKKKGVRHHPMDTCLNCQNKLEKEQFFCPKCGQKVHNSRLTVWSLLGEFFGSLFNIDNGIYRSLVALPIPGFLSKQFMTGKRKSYLNPIRFFLIALIIHIAVLSNLIPIEDVNRASALYLEQIGQSKLQAKYYAAKDSLSTIYQGCDIDSIERIIFADIDVGQDSITPIDIQDDDFPFKSSFSHSLTFHRGDMYELSVDEFLEKYEADSYWERIFMTQMIRTVRDPSGAIRFGMGNLIWSVLFAIIFTGFLMKLLYVRRNRYYVEHLIVLFNIHSFAFLLASVAFGYVALSQNFDSSVDDIAYLFIILFFFLTIKFYYQQGWFKSFVKFFMTAWAYLIFLVLMVLLVTIVSLFFFK